MLLHALLLAAIALGHASLVILAVNVIHGLGLAFKRIEGVSVVALAIGGIATLAGLWWMAGQGWAAWPWPLKVYSGVCLLVGLVGLPVSTILLRFRRLPRGVWTEAQAAESLEAAGTEGESLVGDGPRSFLLRLPGNESLRLLVREARVTIPGLPPGLDGLRLVQVTDLHMAPCYDRRYFEVVADEVGRLEPDLVACTGDVVEHPSAIDWVEPIFGRMRGRLGQVAILGNHDLHFDEGEIRRALARAGFDDVDGRWTQFQVEGASLAVGGTSAPWGPCLALDDRPEADFALLLSHTPDQFPHASRSGLIDLMLCGHNHAGQIRLPLLGPIVMPSVYSRRYDRGFFRQGRTLMYVGQGIGGKHPVRYNCPPEITRIVLHAAPSRSVARGAGRDTAEVGV